ncbi:unnamed protein product [Effrenium voratum]|nr:unnamed protein product [Effrenium voratum]
MPQGALSFDMQPLSRSSIAPLELLGLTPCMCRQKTVSHIESKPSGEANWVPSGASNTPPPLQLLRMVRKALAVFCAGLGLAQSGSVSSCGGPSDHFSNVSIVLSPDPISRSTPFTLTLTGVLDEDHVGGTVDVDLQVKALHVIDKAVKGQTSYTISPGLAKGPQKLVIGPVTLPKDPGDAVLKGQISIKDTQAIVFEGTLGVLGLVWRGGTS